MQSQAAQQIELPPEARRRIVDTSKSNSISKIESNLISHVDDESTNFTFMHLNNKTNRKRHKKESIKPFHHRCNNNRQSFVFETLTTRSKCNDTSFNQLSITRIKPYHLVKSCHIANDSNRTTINRITLKTLLTLMTLSLIDCNLVSAETAAISNNAQPQQQLPTVIVRGFLNYRTTVDGTVLLFTPDAGNNQASSSTAASIQATPMATLPSIIASTSMDRTMIEPSRVADEPTETKSISLSDQADDSRSQVIGASAASGDEWRPIQAADSSNNNNNNNKNDNDNGQRAAGESSSLSPPTPKVGSIVDDEPAAADIGNSNSNNNNGNRPTGQQQSAPVTKPLLASTQADFTTQPSSTPSQQSPRSPTTERAFTVTTGRSHPTKPRRPLLGFNGQTSRAGGRLMSGEQSASSQQQQSPLTNGRVTDANTINGIRRPGIPSSSSSSSSASSSPFLPNGEPNGGPAATSFQARLANANNRLRNKFKRPFHSSPASNQTSTNSATTGATGSASPASLMAHPLSGHSAAVNGGEHSPLLGGGSQTSAFSPNVAPAVGSDEILLSAASLSAGRQTGAVDTLVETGAGSSNGDASSAGTGDLASPHQQPVVDKRLGEQHLSEPKLISGELSKGQLSGGPLNFDALFLNDQPKSESGEQQQQTGEASQSAHSQHRPATHGSPRSATGNNNKLNGWLGAHHNKFVPRPAPAPAGVDRSQQLAVNLHQLQPASQLSPSFNVANIPSTPVQPKPTPVSPSLAAMQTNASEQKPVTDSSTSETTSNPVSGQGEGDSSGNGDAANTQASTVMTKTYSTVMSSIKTRMVPMQVKSSTGIQTITESYVVTKMMTIYQTLPVSAEFIVPDTASDQKPPFELFNEPSSSSQQSNEQQSAAPAPAIVSSPGGAITNEQEQPISLDTAPKSANDWLHDFTSAQANSLGLDNRLGSNNQQHTSTQQNNNNDNPFLSSMLSASDQEANNWAASFLAANGANSNEPLEQLASSLDPSANNNNGLANINIPDLNNPLVLAAAIQNPQLAAVILAAQQLQLKQRAGNKLLANQQQQPLASPQQLAPIYSTSMSTQVHPSTYTVRDTMYTTRLVSFKDGRTMRTRTVSEPGSVIEQVLTTMATEVTPVTITIRPTGVLASGGAATLGPNASGGSGSAQTTLNNALIATQLASLLARRQQQVLQPSLVAPDGGTGAQQQLAALQQLIGQQQQQQQQRQMASKQFQPNLQQLLQSLQRSQQPPQAQQSQPQPQVQVDPANNKPTDGHQQQPQQHQSKADGLQKSGQSAAQMNNAGGQSAAVATPPLPTSAPSLSGPIITTLTSLQVRTYTVHNAFKTIYRTITSTQLITSTLFPPTLKTAAAAMG